MGKTITVISSQLRLHWTLFSSKLALFWLFHVKQRGQIYKLAKEFTIKMILQKVWGNINETFLWKPNVIAVAFTLLKQTFTVVCLCAFHYKNGVLTLTQG